MGVEKVSVEAERKLYEMPEPEMRSAKYKLSSSSLSQPEKLSLEKLKFSG